MLIVHVIHCLHDKRVLMSGSFRTREKKSFLFCDIFDKEMTRKSVLKKSMLFLT